MVSINWQRDWFLPELPVCPKHDCLIETSIYFDEHRHQFLPLNPAYFSMQASSKFVANDLSLAKAASDLLDQPAQQSPTFGQWTHFYHEIATECGCARGKQVDHEKILSLVCSRFDSLYLENKGLLNQSQSNSFWLRSIFRKHRKSFSFLEHIIVWQTLVPTLSVLEIFIKVRRYAHETVVNKSQSSADNAISISDECRAYRQKWEELVLRHGVKPARHQATGGSLYAWLYRHDRDWLLAFNEQQKRPFETVNKRVDWHLRDRQLVKDLIRIHLLSEAHPAQQRMSATWLLNQLPHKNSVAKKLYKLPLTQQFLVRYAESVTEYQLRRISQFIVESREKHMEIKRWSLFRSVGLSEQRITPDTMKILDLLTYL
ncbi:TnsD family Tn7-like transposition protein [uncultured Tolumonas sp.]|uniref:TnsD family Tn7-like transposition protein n=1 Tax=uncultured Tolumonas sp. TaxID=263765 RepID=UPI002A0A3432|nr:TnsD family Tn7-like transposition protein [uncultured Tolumonas sp.]